MLFLSAPISRIIAKILIDDVLEEDDKSLAVGMILKDMQLWKGILYILLLFSLYLITIKYFQLLEVIFINF